MSEPARKADAHFASDSESESHVHKPSSNQPSKSQPSPVFQPEGPITQQENRNYYMGEPSSTEGEGGYSKLALKYLEQGRCDEAEKLFKAALDISEQNLGKNNPRLERNIEELAWFYCHRGKFAD